MALGHPKGLFPLFFTEMWERLAFYTMIGVLLLYTTDFERGGLGLPSAQGNEIYGLYLSFVYFTPFLGGLIADRFLGYRRAVALGGVLMAIGLTVMGLPGFTFFVVGLIGFIIGNGFFKPNISVMVGNLYEKGDPRRDTGFNIFYMGINIGALFATLYLVPVMRNVFGWLWTFRAAGVGVLISVLILGLNWKTLRRADPPPERDPEDTGFGDILLKILVPAFGVGIVGYFLAHHFLGSDGPVRPAVCGFLAGMVPVIIFFVYQGVTAREDEKPGLLALLPIYVAGAAFFMILHLNGSAMTQWARDWTDRQSAGPASAVTYLNPRSEQEALPRYYLSAGEDIARPDPRSLLVVDDVLASASAAPFEAAAVARMFGQQRMDAAAVEVLEAHLPEGLSVERLGSPGTNPQWEARAVSVFEPGVVTVVEGTDSHGAPTVTVELPDGAEPTGQVAFVRALDGRQIATFLVDRQTSSELFDGYRERFGHEPKLLPPGEFLTVINPEVYQSWNPLFVIFLTPLVVAFFQWRVRQKRPVPTANKLLYGMLLTTGALLLMVLAGQMSDGGTVRVSGLWLASFYLVITLGELCLSPIGLSLVTKLSPKRLVGLTMGGWFMATAFGNNFSGFFGGVQHMMSPIAFFLVLSGLSGLVALFIFLVLPKLNAAIQKCGA